MEYPIFAWVNLRLFSQYSNILIGWLQTKEDGRVVTDRASLLFLCSRISGTMHGRTNYKDTEP
jgi:hypothetical protein